MQNDLFFNIIYHYLKTARYDVGQIQGVFETEMSAIVQGYALKVVTGFIVAPVIEDYIGKPYFYFHEYKQKKNAKAPTAQVLLAMLIAQVHNQDGKPIYDCYVIGELWHFMVMQDNKYAMHKGLNATEPDDLQAILLILRKVKQILMLDLVE